MCFQNSFSISKRCTFLISTSNLLQFTVMCWKFGACLVLILVEYWKEFCMILLGWLSFMTCDYKTWITSVCVNPVVPLTEWLILPALPYTTHMGLLWIDGAKIYRVFTFRVFYMPRKSLTSHFLKFIQWETSAI